MNWPALLQSLAPSILDFIKNFFSTHGSFPTEDELKQHLQDDLDKYIAIGDKWLQEHPQQGSEN